MMEIVVVVVVLVIIIVNKQQLRLHRRHRHLDNLFLLLQRGPVILRHRDLFGWGYSHY